MTLETSPNGAVTPAAGAPATHRGLVLGLERDAATPLGFWVYVDPSAYLQLDDVVHVRTAVPTGEVIDVYGVVDEVKAMHEGVSFASDVALVRDGTLPAERVVTAHVAVTRVDPEIYVPPMPGQPVSLAAGEVRERALYFDAMEEQLPLGLSRGGAESAGEPVYANLAFLDGAKGAHVNISGVSGVATKTSYATFLLYALFEGDVLGSRRANSKALIFNVKGEDLLFLDQPNAKVLGDPDERDKYRRLGLPAGPFGSVCFFAPVMKGSQPIPDTGSRQEGVTGFFWTLHEFCEKRYLRYLFADADQETSQLSYVVDIVESQLHRAAQHTPFDGFEGDVTIEGERVGSFHDLVEVIEANLDPDGSGDWARGGSAATIGTIRAFMRRLRAAQRHVGHLIRGSEFRQADKHRIALSRQVTVVDLHRLHDRAQRFVVGVLLATVMEQSEGRGASERPAPTFVVVDELNKYAPREGRSPIKEVLLDIAERGRSLGVILLGAQQTASEVEQRIVANSSLRVVGRLDSAEAQRAEYRFLGTAMRERAGLLKPGSMILQQPEIPVPLLIQFPHPSWATRKSEVAPKPPERDVMSRFDD